MYKVFFNQKSIVISAPGNITLKKSCAENVDLWTGYDIMKWFGEFAENDCTVVYLLHNHPEEFFKKFYALFVLIQAAGGVVYRGNSVLFIFRNEKWDLPKGKIDYGETAEEAAVREVHEECGISGHKITRALPVTYHIYRSYHRKNSDEWIFKKTFWYEMEYSGTYDGNPQTDEGITQIRWFLRNEMDEVFYNTWENLKQIIIPQIRENPHKVP